MTKLLQVKDLVVKFKLRTGDLTALNGISFDLNAGEKMGLVGESGAGKSVAGFSIINLISKPGYIHSGEILLDDQVINTLDFNQIRDIRGNRISMIFQDPMMTLNPVLTIGSQMTETVLAHKKVSKARAREIALENLRKVYIPSPEKRLEQYPYELSGGMRQRVVIAISLLTGPNLIIADEPTTALDVTIQAEIMDLLLQLCVSERMGLILITHDLGVVSQTTDKIAVMYAGRIVEQGTSKDVSLRPQHPYTKGLLAALPQQGTRGQRLSQIPGMMPNLTSIPQGCPFHPRCDKVMPICVQTEPKFYQAQGSATRVACHLFAAGDKK